MRILTALALSSAAAAAQGGDQPIELGAVHWLRDHTQAFRTALEEGKPVLLLFQEVPG